MLNLHAFEKSGNGRAPFHCVGFAAIPSPSLAEHNVEAYNRALRALPKDVGCGTCDHCGTAIMNNFIIESSDGNRFVVGCDCVAKTGDAGLVKEVRAERLRTVREKREAGRRLARTERETLWAAERAARGATFKIEHAGLIKRAEPFMDVDFIQSLIERGTAGGFMSDRALAALVSVVTDQEARVARRANSKHTGVVGKRQTFTATVVRVRSYARPRYASYGDETVWIISMTDTEGNTIVSKSASFHAAKGETLTFKATVKAHDEYQGERQTVVQRIAVVSTAVAA
jgi:hypothetical protein